MSDTQSRQQHLQFAHAQQALWTVASGEALSLIVGPGQRELSVAAGRLWLTLEGTAERPAEDLWLEPGQSVQLASGSKIVIEAWPEAQFQLLVPPAACPQLQRQRAAHRGGAPVAGWPLKPASLAAA